MRLHPGQEARARRNAQGFDGCVVDVRAERAIAQQFPGSAEEPRRRFARVEEAQPGVAVEPIGNSLTNGSRS